MPRLIELDLSFNTIDHLAEDAFSKCPKLRQLDLSGNYLTNFNGALQELQNLKRLNSSFNMIQLLQWDEFPVTMTHLEMSNNQITLLSSTQRSRIRHVQLQRNRIMALTDEQIPNTVEYVNLSDNLIHTIDNGTFRNKQFLSNLDLRKNQLTKLEIAAFMVDSLTTGHPVRLSVADNPLDCSCEMDWIRNNKHEKSLIDIIDDNRAVCLHRIYNRRILLSEVRKDDLLCNYKQVCEPNCICCQYGNCDCKSKMSRWLSLLLWCHIYHKYCTLYSITIGRS
ncbi:hypothetical protein WUBG_08751 [Wuchereria bancrofti]|uniref:Leucine Rich Repeat family protein n=1 Tax=Wuchereria bancrofti TaxID=6293 RepID=J9ETB0_WUCBA|nr:hypothetical protein WUBG_08751 [Wuchereria bancrofti]